MIALSTKLPSGTDARSHNPDTVLKIVGEFLGGFQGQRRLAHAAGAKGRNQLVLADELHEPSHLSVPGNAFRPVQRQISAGASSWRHALLDTRGDRAHVAVAAAMDSCDKVWTEGLAQGRYVNVEGILFHDRAGPHDIEQLALLDQHIGPLEEHEEHVDAARAEFNRSARPA